MDHNMFCFHANRPPLLRCTEKRRLWKTADVRSFRRADRALIGLPATVRHRDHAGHLPISSKAFSPRHQRKLQ